MHALILELDVATNSDGQGQIQPPAVHCTDVVNSPGSYTAHCPALRHTVLQHNKQLQEDDLCIVDIDKHHVVIDYGSEVRI
jgi:hypothetical protein